MLESEALVVKVNPFPEGDSLPPCSAREASSPLLTEEEVKELRDIFLPKPKFQVSTTVPEPVHHRLQRYPGGVSGFLEEAITSYSGSLNTLVKAAAQLEADRRESLKHCIAIKPANGRVSKASFQRLEELQAQLREAGIRGVSRSKVLAGLIQTKLREFV